MQDRKYQIDHIAETYANLMRERVWLMQNPTGAGKTVEFAIMAQRFIRETGKAVIIFVHRKELMHQAAKQIREIAGIEPYLITSTTSRYAIARVYIGMVESTLSRMDLFTNVGLVIIDECHIAVFNKVIPLFMDEYILGVTATPLSTSKKFPLKSFYNGITPGPHIKELIALGYLSQNITRCPKDIVDATKFDIDRLNDDYDTRQMAQEYKLPKHVTNTVKNYRKFCRREKTLVFNVNIEHSREVAECFHELGYNCRHLGSDNEHERDEILKWFKETKDAILCNVMIATVGFDEPTIRNIILNFSTLSIVKYIQCCGRGSRIMDMTFIDEFQIDYPYQLETKEYFNIIDLGGNGAVHADWNEDRDWEDIFRWPPVPGNGIAPVKTCPNCDGLLHAAARYCNLRKADGELCLYEFPKKPYGIEQDIEEMIMITKGVNIEGLVSKSRKKYEYYPMLDMGYDIVKDMYRSFGANPKSDIINKYFRSYYLLCCEWYEKFKIKPEGSLESIEDSGFHIRLARNNFKNIFKKISNGYEIDITKFYDWNKTKEDELTVEEFREKYLGYEKTA